MNVTYTYVNTRRVGTVYTLLNKDLVLTRLSWKVATPHTRQSSRDSETVVYTHNHTMLHNGIN